MIRRVGDLALRWLTALALAVLITFRSGDTGVDRNAASGGSGMSPLCWEERLARMAGEFKMPIDKPPSLWTNGCYPAPPKAMPGLSPKAEIALLRHRDLMAEFFRDSATLGLQRRTVAAELHVERDPRIAAFTELATKADTPGMVWRAEIALALTHLRFGELSAARTEASRALAVATEYNLAPQMAADAYYILGLTNPSRAGALADLIAARQADPFFFDANLKILVAVAELLRDTTRPSARLVLLDQALPSVEYLGALDDRGLLVELQLDWPSGSRWLNPEGALLYAYMRWFTGQIDESEATVVAALTTCRSRSPICERLTGLLDVIRRARSDE